MFRKRQKVVFYEIFDLLHLVQNTVAQKNNKAWSKKEMWESF